MFFLILHRVIQQSLVLNVFNKNKVPTTFDTHSHVLANRRFCLSVYTLFEHTNKINCKHHPFHAHYAIDGIVFQLISLSVSHALCVYFALGHNLGFRLCGSNRTLFCVISMRQQCVIESKETHSNTKKSEREVNRNPVSGIDATQNNRTKQRVHAAICSKSFRVFF